MGTCKECGGEIETIFRYCPWCGRAQRIKLTEFFAGHSGIEAASHRALRISRYLGEDTEERHVRFSVWSEPTPGDTKVEAAVSLDEDEAGRVARFLAATPGTREADTEVL